ncbi:transposase [Luteimonas terrae]|uniref:REP element-mobilizing transposase RayT n=1 Tax=Luteimonas terrae TaxID=1530191 RepID=A0ABU1Y332_9GAMM|nr:transposase [Luteimonas terrae]MDR7194870.1 REP element-mobilizing transposase RayT [Luteimonas terrae]
MGRAPRFDLPGVPQHIVQRGNNRVPCFLDDRNRLGYLYLLRGALLATGVQLHAYVLMDNHVHLLATPHGPGDLSRIMQKLGASTSACSMPATAAPARFEKAVTRPVWSATPVTC